MARMTDTELDYFNKFIKRQGFDDCLKACDEHKQTNDEAYKFVHAILAAQRFVNEQHSKGKDK